MSDQFKLAVTRTIPAPRKEVFEAWLSPDALAEFMRHMQEISVAKVEVDAREGGAFLIVMQAGDEELPHRGEYRTINRYEQLAFTWISPATIPGSLVTFDFVERGSSETEVTLHHIGFPSEEMCANHEKGWTGILETLGTTLGSRL